VEAARGEKGGAGAWSAGPARANKSPGCTVRTLLRHNRWLTVHLLISTHKTPHTIHHHHHRPSGRLFYRRNSGGQQSFYSWIPEKYPMHPSTLQQAPSGIPIRRLLFFSRPELDPFPARSRDIVRDIRVSLHTSEHRCTTSNARAAGAPPSNCLKVRPSCECPPSDAVWERLTTACLARTSEANVLCATPSKANVPCASICGYRLLSRDPDSLLLLQSCCAPQEDRACPLPVRQAQ